MDRKTAVALRYLQEEDKAPKIIASGRGKIAQKIMEIAEKHDIPIYEDPEVVEILSQLEVGIEIPPELYEVVAEILAFVYSLDKSVSDKKFETLIES